MIHADQRIITAPGYIFYPHFLADIRDQCKIIDRKYHIIVRFPQFVFNDFFKFRIDIIIAKMLFDIIHRMPQ